jgi:hypothetical protein
MIYINGQSRTVHVQVNDSQLPYTFTIVSSPNDEISPLADDAYFINKHPNDQRVIFLDDFNLSPIDKSMLQAFYSRSGDSILFKLAEMGVSRLDVNSSYEDRLAKYFVQYNHESIGDCANLTICVENVPLPVAKLIQADPLYNGQESSTRYIDFNTRLENYPEHKELYTKEVTRLTEKFISEGMTEKSARIKAFDIARGILPLGTLTQLSWCASLRPSFSTSHAAAT